MAIILPIWYDDNVDCVDGDEVMGIGRTHGNGMGKGNNPWGWVEIGIISLTMSLSTAYK